MAFLVINRGPGAIVAVDDVGTRTIVPPRKHLRIDARKLVVRAATEEEQLDVLKAWDRAMDVVMEARLLEGAPKS